MPIHHLGEFPITIGVGPHIGDQRHGMLWIRVPRGQQEDSVSKIPFMTFIGDRPYVLRRGLNKMTHRRLKRQIQKMGLDVEFIEVYRGDGTQEVWLFDEYRQKYGSEMKSRPGVMIMPDPATQANTVFIHKPA